RSRSGSWSRSPPATTGRRTPTRRASCSRRSTCRRGGRRRRSPPRSRSRPTSPALRWARRRRSCSGRRRRRRAIRRRRSAPTCGSPTRRTSPSAASRRSPPPPSSARTRATSRARPSCTGGPRSSARRARRSARCTRCAWPRRGPGRRRADRSAPAPAPAPLVTPLALLEIPYPWIDPVALDLPGPLDVRWYGLAYLCAFLAGYLVLRRLSRERFLPLDPDAAGDLIFTLIVGTILGGRVGYILFYDFARFAENPARIVRIWEGGLSFHGGLLGVLLAAWWFARKHRVPFLRLGDGLALAIPFGLFFGRLANFVNGELYGRVTGPGLPWAMRFPTDPVAQRLLGIESLPLRERELAIEAAYDSGRWDAVRELVPLR